MFHSIILRSDHVLFLLTCVSVKFGRRAKFSRGKNEHFLKSTVDIFCQRVQVSNESSEMGQKGRKFPLDYPFP